MTVEGICGDGCVKRSSCLQGSGWETGAVYFLAFMYLSSLQTAATYLRVLAL